MRKYGHIVFVPIPSGAVFRIRHNMAIAIHQYFHEHGFYYFHTPLITGSDAEGAGNMFQVTTLDLDRVAKGGEVDYSADFFGKRTNLTVSGQLEGELGATALGAIYTSVLPSVLRIQILHATWLSSGWLSLRLPSLTRTN